MTRSLRLAAVFTCSCALFGLAIAPLRATENNYSFKVHNTTDYTIKKLLASEDGETYSNFDIGKGIGPGKTVELIWDKSTDEGKCEWWFKAIFDDDEESEAVQIDFCEEDLVLEF